MTQWPSEIRSYTDARTGARVRQLTNHKGHSHHLYFTNPGWFADGRRMLFGSDRGNRTNLFSIDLASGEITQHTDDDTMGTGGYQAAFLNPLRDEVYFWRGREMVALDLPRGRQRRVYQAPESTKGGMLSVTADGKAVCTSVSEDLSQRLRLDFGNGYVGFDDYFAAKPRTAIVSIPLDGGPSREVYSEQRWLSHVNTSPTQSHLITYCEEGPWIKVEQRLWGMDLGTGQRWPIRPRLVEGERIGHEYWMADGLRVGYHGSRTDGTWFTGHAKYDDTDRREWYGSVYMQHVHANTPDLIVGDGGRDRLAFLRLWKWDGQKYLPPRMLCEHRCSAHSQFLHVHPRFSPDGTKVVFTSDKSGYGQVYEVEVPPFESLPEFPTN